MESKTKVKTTLTEEQRKAVGALLVDILAGEIRDETRLKLHELDRAKIPEPYNHLVSHTRGSGMDGDELARGDGLDVGILLDHHHVAQPDHADALFNRALRPGITLQRAFDQAKQMIAAFRKNNVLLGVPIARITLGDPAVEGVRMGPLVGNAQRNDVWAALDALSAGAEIVQRVFD